MPSAIELRSIQKRMLFTLKKIESDNAPATVKGLHEHIIALQAEMEQEDVALVEKLIAEV